MYFLQPLTFVQVSSPRVSSGSASQTTLKRRSTELLEVRKRVSDVQHERKTGRSWLMDWEFNRSWWFRFTSYESWRSNTCTIIITSLLPQAIFALQPCTNRTLPIWPFEELSPFEEKLQSRLIKRSSWKWRQEERWGKYYQGIII